MDWTTILLSLFTPLSGIVGWFAGSHKRRNDFISDLQDSIDLLTQKYTDTLNRLTLAQEENQKFQTGQAEMLGELREVRKENAALKASLEEIKRENTLLKKTVDDLHFQINGIKTITKME
ncbi:MAG: hypothetical protein RRX93_07810 [Bacteroidales bacterium]